MITIIIKFNILNYKIKLYALNFFDAALIIIYYAWKFKTVS